MKIFKQMLAAAAFVLVSHTAAQAGVVQIQLVGFNLTYDESSGVISSPGGVDPLFNMVFIEDGVLLGSLNAPGDNIAAAVIINLLGNPDPTVNASTAINLAGFNIFDALINGGPGLLTDISSGQVSFSNGSINATGTGFSDIFAQNLPFGLTAYDPINWSFSTGLGACTGAVGARTCTYAGTGELSWATPVPEPAMLSLLSIGLLGLGLTMRRRSTT